MNIDPDVHTELDVIHGALDDSRWMPSAAVTTALADAVYQNLRLLRALKAINELQTTEGQR